MVDQTLFKCDDCGTVLSEPPELVETQRGIWDPPDSAQPAIYDQFCEACQGLDTFEEIEVTDIIPAFFDRCDNPCDVDCCSCIKKAIENYNNELDISN